MFDLIKSRRSVRKFTVQKVSDDIIDQIITAGIRAPSGKNNQPWKFAVIRDQELKKKLSCQTIYGKIILNAPVCIVVFLDQDRVYNLTKDIQAIGACIQNMLLAIHSSGLGGVWLGEILNNRKKVEQILEAPDNLELMAVVVLGYPAEKKGGSLREGIDKVVYLRR